MGIPEHLTCLLRNLYVDQEATVSTGHGTTDWFQIKKGVRQGYILSPCLFNLYADYIMRNAGLDEAQAGIKIAGRQSNHLRYADDITRMAERDVFLELSCFFHDPADVGNLISGSSAFSKPSLYIWKFTVHVLLKPGLEKFENYFASMCDECNCAVVAFLWEWNEN